MRQFFPLAHLAPIFTQLMGGSSTDDDTAICINEQCQEADHIVDLIESTSDSGESEEQGPSPEVEKRHASRTGSMGREDSGSGAAEKASTVDTGGVGRDPTRHPASFHVLRK